MVDKYLPALDNQKGALFALVLSRFRDSTGFCELNGFLCVPVRENRDPRQDEDKARNATGKERIESGSYKGYEGVKEK